MKALFAVLCLFVIDFSGVPAFASEIDDISSYYLNLADSSAVLNDRVQAGFNAGLQATNGCDFTALGKAIGGELASFRFYSGAFERFAGKSDQVARIHYAIADSIYRDTSFATSIVGTFYGLDASLNINGFRVGTDKLGHFMDHGWNLYDMSLHGKSIDDLLNHSVEEEEGGFGWITTGIKSYGDMSANFDGFRFWANVFGTGQNPYFACDGQSLKQLRPFTINEYVSEAWSEAINCNVYVDEEFTRIVSRNISELDAKDGVRHQCPLRKDACKEMREHYAPWLPAASIEKVISPLCR